MKRLRRAAATKSIDYRETVGSDDEKESKTAPKVANVELEQPCQPEQPPPKKEVFLVPNRVLSTPEIVEAKEDIENDVVSLGELEIRIQERRAELSGMEKLLEELGERIYLKRWTISKLRTFPDELISLIFEAYMKCGDNMNPWLLMQICRHWRSVAIHTRRLWSKIMLGTRGRYHKMRRYHGYEFCYSPALLRDALSRTAEGPIDLTFEFFNYRSSSSGDSDEESKGVLTSLQELVNVLRETDAVSRVRTLELTSTSEDVLRGLNFGCFTFPALREVTLKSSSPSLNEAIQTTARRLQILRIKASPGGRLNWNLSKLTSLVYLKLSASHGLMPLEQDALRTIRSAHGLVELSLSNITLPTSGSEPLRISTLRTLHLNRSTILCRLDLPHLHSLHITKSLLSTGQTDFLFLPSLEYLQLCEITADESPRIRAPSIQTLEIEWPSSAAVNAKLLEKVFQQLIKPGHIAPQAICFHSGSIDSKFLAKILYEIPYLTELTFSRSTALSKPFFDALAGFSLPLKPNSQRSPPMCPSLQCLKLGLTGIRRPQCEASMVKWGRLAIRSRCQGQFPIKEALVQEDDNTPWRNLL
ncbi:hypothetical protein FRC14_003191 [Serendipita sp. 396]|nr:hypothetical protein FRC14_003191 [Serendipita sp. 396]